MMMKRFCLFAACACLLVDMSYAQRKVEVWRHHRIRKQLLVKK